MPCLLGSLVDPSCRMEKDKMHAFSFPPGTFFPSVFLVNKCRELRRQVVVISMRNGPALAVRGDIVDTEHIVCCLWTSATEECVPEDPCYVRGMGFHVLFCALCTESQACVCALWQCLCSSKDLQLWEGAAMPHLSTLGVWGELCETVSSGFAANQMWLWILAHPPKVYNSGQII